MNELNELIKTIFTDFTVNGVSIPVKFLYYHGHGEPYVVYQEMDANNSISGDDDYIGYVDYFDFDVYAKGDIFSIIESVKKLLKEHGFVWQASRTSPDMYETDTGYYHKTLNFAFMREITEQEESE